MRIAHYCCQATFLFGLCTASSGLVEARQVWSGTRGVSEMRLAQSMILDESQELLSDVHSVGILPSGGVVVTSSQIAQVLVFGADGRFVRKLGRWGSGPFEYNMPTRVHVFGESIYVFDQNGLKLIQYDLGGEGIREIKGFITGNRDFSVSDDGAEVTYIIPDAPEGFIRTLRARDGSVTGRFGKESFEHVIGMRLGGTGLFVREGQSIFYASPIKPIVYRLNLVHNELFEASIPDADFKYVKTGYESVGEINQNMNRIPEYLFTNSTVLGVYRLADNFVVVVEDGKYPLEAISSSYGLTYSVRAGNERRKKLFIFSKDLEFIDVIELNYPFHQQYGMRIVGTTSSEIIFFNDSIAQHGESISRILTFFKITLTAD